jgi:tRNA(fMet)-specific endonuclease VapC
MIPPADQATTAITMGELLYGAAKKGSSELTERVHDLLAGALTILAFDDRAAGVYGPLRAELEARGRPLAEPDLRIACIALAQDATLVTGNVKHFSRVPNLRVEDWL